MHIVYIYSIYSRYVEIDIVKKLGILYIYSTCTLDMCVCVGVSVMYLESAIRKILCHYFPLRLVFPVNNKHNLQMKH